MAAALLVLIAAALVARLVGAFIFRINKDEFHYLSQVYASQAGRLSTLFQTFHVHLFGWLHLVSTNEANQIIAARLVMWGAGVLTAALLFRFYRRFLSIQAALFSLLVYCAFSYVVENGPSFRGDPLAALLLVAAACTLMVPGILRALVAGSCIAVATLITVKSVFFFPTLAILTAHRLITSTDTDDRRRFWRDVAILVSAAIVGSVVLLALHKASLAPANLGAQFDTLGGAYSKTLSHAGWFPRLGYLLFAIKENAVFFITAAIGLIVALNMVLRANRATRITGILFLALAAPLSSLVVYRNAFPYFYTFILPFPAALCGLTFDRIRQTSSPRTATVITSLGLLLVSLQTAIAFSANMDDTLTRQRRVIAAIHHIFPIPEPYIDCCMMIASYPHVGFFMSTWGFENYRARGKPLIADDIRTRQPKFLLADYPPLQWLAKSSKSRLLPRDAAAIHQNYIHYWGPIYIAGKRLTLASRNPTIFHIEIAGIYTMKATAAAIIDGHTVAPSSNLYLGPGTHIARATRQESIILLWDTHLPRSFGPAPAGPLFPGFTVF